jgi:Zn-finger domain-containing protein
MAEIEENVRFLQENDLAGVTSSLGSGLELRLQLGSRYLDSLYTTEEKLGTKLFDRQLDVNTLTYPSFYLEGDVSEVVSTVRNWNALLRPIYYPLKNLSRYGVGGILQEQSQNIRIILTQTRQTFLQRISEAIASVKYSGEISDNINEQFAEDLQYLGNRITTLFKDAPDLITKDPVFASMLAVAKSQAAKQTFKNGHDELG